MNLVQECAFKAMLKPPVPIGAGPIGTRMYYDVIGGEVTGERLRGKVLGGGEWALIGPDGFLRIDVRVQVETHDGAYLYIQYVGLLGLNDAVQRALATGGGTDYGDQYFFTNPAHGDRRSALRVGQHDLLRRRGSRPPWARRRVSRVAPGITGAMGHAERLGRQLGPG